MRVFEDEYMDCALLAFERVVINPTVRISVRSLLLYRGAYLGPNGTSQAQPYFFTVERIVTEYGARFRAGPELTAYMHKFDRVEVRSDDEWLCEEGVWGNAHSPAASMPAGHVMEITRTPAAPAWNDTPSTSRRVKREEDFDRALAGLVAYPKQAREQEYGTAAISTAHQEPERNDDLQIAAASPPKARQAVSGSAARWLVSGIIAFSLAAIGFIAAPDVRCAVMGEGCNPSTLNDDQRLERAGAAVAQNCAANRKKAADVCSIEQECITPYRTQFPSGGALDKLNRIAAAAAADCEAAKQRVQQAEAQKQQQPRPQEVAVVLAAQAHSEPQNLITGSDGADAKEAEQLFSSARQCATANPCLATVCYADVRKRYPIGERANDMQAELINANRLCSEHPTAALPDGVYNGRAMAGCGAPQQFGIPVTVRGGRITWQHDAILNGGNAPAAVQWNGTIDREGNISASARSAAEFQASGRYQGDEREIAMHYPGCVATLSISGRMR